eukprot:Nk52_evm21s2011 gene=Nk52_evmTU21s2011
MFHFVMNRELGVHPATVLTRAHCTRRWLDLDLSNHVRVQRRTGGGGVGGITSMDFDQSEHRYVLTGNADCSVVIYDMQEQEHGEEGAHKKVIKPVCSVQRGDEGAHKYGVRSVCWFPHDTGMFTTGSSDKVLKVWDTNEMVPVTEFPMFSQIYHHSQSLASATPFLVAVGTRAQCVYLVDLRSGANSHRLNGHGEGGGVPGVCWSPTDENLLATGGMDGKLLLWDVRNSGGYLHSFQMGQGEVSENCWVTQEGASAGEKRKRHHRRQGRRVMEGQWEGYPSDEEAEDEEGMGMSEHKEEVKTKLERDLWAGYGKQLGGDKGAESSPSSSRSRSGVRGTSTLSGLAASQRNVRSAHLRETRRAHTKGINGVQFTSDGLRILSTGLDNRVRMWDAFRCTDSLVHYTGIRNSSQLHMQFSVTPRWDCTPDLMFHPCGSDVNVYEILSGRKLYTLKGHYKGINCVVACTVGQQLLSAGRDNQLLVYTPREEERKMDEELKEMELRRKREEEERLRRQGLGLNAFEDVDGHGVDDSDHWDSDLDEI